MQSWLIELAIEPKSKADEDRLGTALAGLAAEDPSFLFSINPESGRVILKGMDETHLDAKVGFLKRIHKVEVMVGAPQVAYRETITRKAGVDYSHKKLTGGSGQFARVILEIEPNEKGKGYEFTSKIVDDAVPAAFIPGVERGLNSAISSGVVAGFPVLDVRVALVVGAYHECDSSAIAFEIAARAALQEGLQKAGSVLLEPVMKVAVATPEDYLGAVIGDLNLRHGQIIGTGSHRQVVNAVVPLANMLGYAKSLRLMSQGCARFSMQFDHYALVSLPVPGDDPPFRPAMGMRT